MSATAIATEATRRQTVIEHQSWCSNHHYDVGFDDEGHDVIEGFCQGAKERLGDLEAFLSNGSRDGAPRVYVLGRPNADDELTSEQARGLAAMLCRLADEADG